LANRRVNIQFMNPIGPSEQQIAEAITKMIEKPSEEEVFEAYTNMVKNTGLKHPEIRKMMLIALNNLKKEHGMDYLEKVTSDNIWKKIGRFF